jgi:ribonuclease Z
MKNPNSANKPMGLIWKALIAAVALIVIVALAAVIFATPILTAMATNTIKQRFISQSQKWDDGLYAGLAGTAGPFPDIKRAGPCMVVLAGGHLYIVDAGQGAARNIALMGFPVGKVDAVLLTHFHSDHIADLGEIMMQRWVGGSNEKPLDVIGPPGVETVVEGFNRAYKLDDGYRVAHHGALTVPPSGAGGMARPFSLSSEEDASVIVIDGGGLKVTAFKVNHAPVSPVVGYRFDYKGRSLVISGDTLPCESLTKQARGADILFQSALQPAMVKLIHDQAGFSSVPSLAKITEDIPGYHSSPEDAAKTASGAGVKQLVLYHITPPIPNPLLNNIYLGDAGKYFKGPITIGEDGMLFSLPANSGKISVSNPLK